MSAKVGRYAALNVSRCWVEVDGARRCVVHVTHRCTATPADKSTVLDWLAGAAIMATLGVLIGSAM